MSKNEQKEPWFLEINPNGRIPAITDTYTDGKPIRIFESGAILQYLIDRYDKDHKISYPKDSREHWEVTSWVGGHVQKFQSNNTLKDNRLCGRWAGLDRCRVNRITLVVST